MQDHCVDKYSTNRKHRANSFPPFGLVKSGTVALGLAAFTAAFLPTFMAASPALGEVPKRPEAIAAAKTLTVCIWPSYYGVTYRNPRDGSLRGIDIDMAQALAQQMGVKAQFVDSSFANFIDDLNADRCDIAMFGIGQTEARRRLVDLSDPVMRSGVYAVTSEANDTIGDWGDIDQPGRIIAVQKGTVMEPCALQTFKNARVLSLGPTESREDEVLSGRADAFLTDYPYSLRMQFQNDWAKVIAPPQIVNPIDYGYAIKKGQPAWLAYINRFIAEAKRDGRLAAAARAHQMEPILLQD